MTTGKDTLRFIGVTSISRKLPIVFLIDTKPMHWLFPLSFL